LCGRLIVIVEQQEVLILQVVLPNIPTV
jgi:hypothetical protein